MKRFPNFALSSYLGWDEKKGWKFSDKDFVFSSEKIYICDIFDGLLTATSNRLVLIFSKGEASDVENLSFSFSPFFFPPEALAIKCRFSFVQRRGNYFVSSRKVMSCTLSAHIFG